MNETTDTGMAESKGDITRTAIATAISTICASIILSIIFGFTGDNKQLKDEMKTKASIPYVDQKCLEIKTDLNRESDIRFEAIDKKLDLIIELSGKNNQK